MTVVLSAFYVANYPEGGGHFWEYMQFVQGLRQIGCDVYWLESLQGRHKAVPNAEKIALFAERMERYGMGGKFIVEGPAAPSDRRGAATHNARLRPRPRALCRRRNTDRRESECRA